MMVGGEALDREALQQGGAGVPARRERELPRDVLGIVQTGVQALAAERARQVPGIAEKEPTALCQTRNHALVHPERRRPSDILHRRVGGDSPTDRGRDDLGRARAPDVPTRRRRGRQ